jgi:hypothetical protein
MGFSFQTPGGSVDAIESGAGDSQSLTLVDPGRTACPVGARERAATPGLAYFVSIVGDGVDTRADLFRELSPGIRSDSQTNWVGAADREVAASF